MLEHVRIALAQRIMEALAADCCVMIGDSPGCARWSFPTQLTTMDTTRANTLRQCSEGFHALQNCQHGLPYKRYSVQVNASGGTKERGLRKIKN